MFSLIDIKYLNEFIINRFGAAGSTNSTKQQVNVFCQSQNKREVPEARWSDTFITVFYLFIYLFIHLHMQTDSASSDLLQPR